MRAAYCIVTICFIVFGIWSCKPPKDKWMMYNRDPLFTVMLPDTPSVSVKTEQTPFGKQPVHYIVWKPATLELNKFKLFQIRYFNIPAGKPGDTMSLNATLDTCINLRKRDFTENEITSEPITVSNRYAKASYTGRAFIFNPPTDNVVTIVKEVAVGNKLFDLTAIAKRNYPTNGQLDSFFNSFAVHSEGTR